MASRGTPYIGTSGWSYDHWKGTFYPDDLPNDRQLKEYASHFSTAEINNSFYQLPDPDTLKRWKDEAGSHFTFAVKASRYITHQKKLLDPEQPVKSLMERVDVLKTKLGPILFQLPGNWNVNAGRLKDFLEVLPTGQRYAFEFRDPSWHNDEVFELLSRKNAAFVIYDFGGTQSPPQVTASFVYLRLHGPSDKAYQGKYPDDTLDHRAKQIDGWLGEGKDVYCYFDNDQNGYAPDDARRLMQRLNS